MKFLILLLIYTVSISSGSFQQWLSIVLFADTELPALQTETGAIAGTVRSSDSQPITYALVMISGRGRASSNYKTMTDNLGRFTISSLPVGQYEIQVSSSNPWLHDGTKSISVRRSESTKVEMVLVPNTECDNAAGYLVSHADKSEIVEAMLQEFVTTQRLDEKLVVDKQIILSTKGLESVQISTPTGMTFTLLSPDALQARADRQGDFTYLQFEKFDARGACVAVELSKVWADGTSSIETGSRTLLGQIRLYYVFHKESGKWIPHFLQGSIT